MSSGRFFLIGAESAKLGHRYWAGPHMRSPMLLAVQWNALSRVVIMSSELTGERREGKRRCCLAALIVFHAGVCEPEQLGMKPDAGQVWAVHDR